MHLKTALMKLRNFGKLDFKKFHPSGNLANKLKTASDIMLKKKEDITGENIEDRRYKYINEKWMNEWMIKEECI